MINLNVAGGRELTVQKTPPRAIDKDVQLKNRNKKKKKKYDSELIKI